MNIYLFSFHCHTTEKYRLPFAGTSLLCVVPGQQQEDFPDYTPRIPTTANELPEGAGHTFLMTKPLQSKPSRKETRLGEPAALQGKLCLGTHTQNAHKEIKHPVQVRNINARGGYPACGEQTANPAWWLGEKWLFCVHGNPTLSHEEKDVAAAFMTRG